GSTTWSCTSHIVVHTSSRNQRSWVITSSAPVPLGQRCFRCSASQAMPSTSRWLVGSPRNSMADPKGAPVCHGNAIARSAGRLGSQSTHLHTCLDGSPLPHAIHHRPGDRLPRLVRAGE